MRVITLLKTIIPCLFLSSFFVVSAQQNSLDIKSLYFENISTKDKLPNSVIRNIDQDSLGLLWFSSNDGLFRYDGQSYQIFRNSLKSSSSISYNYIPFMRLDHSGNPWMLFSGSIDKLDAKSGKIKHYYGYQNNTRSSLGNTYQLTFSPQNNVFATSLQYGLLSLSHADTSIQYFEKEKIKFPELAANLEAITYSQNCLFVGKKNNGIYKIQLSDSDSKIDRVVKLIESDHAETYTIHLDNKNRLWAGTSNGLIYHNINTGATKVFRYNPKVNNFLPDKEILSLFIDDNNFLWIGSRENGLSIVSIAEIETNGDQAKGMKYTTNSLEGSLANRCINTIYKDRDGKIWLGTYSGGIDLVNEYRNKIHSLKFIPGHSQSTMHPKVWGITQAKDGNIWLGTDGGGIDVWNPKQGIIKRLKNDASGNGLSDNAILCALTAKNGDLWFGTYRGGINRINPATGRIKIYEKVPSPVQGSFCSDIRCIFQDSSGKIWIGTNWNGISYYNESTDSFTNIPELGIIDVRAIIESPGGGLWIGTHSRGLIWYNPNTKEQKFFVTNPDNPNSIPSDDIYALKVDRSGKLWIGTQYGGLSCYTATDQSFTTFDSKNGLANNTVLAILEDSRGFFWLSTNEGISRFDPKTSTFINYDQSNGVLPGEFLNNSCISATDGTFYFGGSNGLNFFNPEFIQPSKLAPKVVFTELKIFNEQIFPGSGVIDKNIEFTPKISLNHQQSVFTIGFQAIQFPFSAKCQYNYMLEGYDEKWNHGGYTNSATYRQIPPGDYILKVKASNSDGVWSEQIASVRIEIIPPFWKTIWAYILYILFLTLVIRFIFLFRMNQIRTLNQLHYEQKIRQKEQKIHHERLDFFTNISHELRTPLTLVECAVDDLKRLLGKTKNEKINEAIKTASFHSSRLLQLINQLLEFRRVETGTPQISVEHINLNEWMSAYLANFKELADSKSVFLKLAMPVKPIDLWVDSDKLSMIMNNLLSNAFKYTPKKGTIEVSTQENEQEIFIEVADSGSGISPKALPNIFDRYFKTESRSTSTGIGLSLTKSLIELHDGGIKVSSSLGKGSKFTVIFRTGNEHFKPEQIKSTVNNDLSISAEKVEILPTIPEERLDHKIMLIIEDNHDISTLLAEKFAQNFEVHIADNGEIGIELARKLIPDIVISDIMMPGIQGTEVCKTLKKSQATSHIPIILLTAKGTVDDELVGLTTGADDYISKPFNFRILDARVNTLIRNRVNLKNYFNEKDFDHTEKPPTNTLLIQEQEFLLKTEQLILEKYLNSDSSVFKLAEDLNFSRSSLYRKIKMLTGLSINEFARSVKIKKAAELLESESITISEAAYRTGFNDLKYFRENFVKQIGITPSEYKKNQKKHEK
ncbi:MAG: response regulator [Prolixibacteraceae bacterium]|nr:response regulator [Prolixibacteraceae bacterium]